jgi:hypothetical protein
MTVINLASKQKNDNQIIHQVIVDRSRTPQQALNACGRDQIEVYDEVVETIPLFTTTQVRLVYFKIKKQSLRHEISCSELQNEYEKRGLIPDPQAQIDDNIAHPEFADEKLNVCQWIDKDGFYCWAIFEFSQGTRSVGVASSNNSWDLDCWFAGVPKQELS